MQHTRIVLISLFLSGMILSTTAFANAVPPMAIALAEGRTHDQAHDTGYIDWNGPVQYTYMAHRDFSELPPEEGGAFCGSGCWEWVTHLGNGGTVSGSFDRDVAYFEVMAASSHDSSVGNATLRACSAATTRDMYGGPGAGMPGFVSLILSVPAGCRSWSRSASSGYIDFRSADVVYGAPPPVPTNTWTPSPSFTPTVTSTATLTPTATNTPTSTTTPTITPTNTPSPTPTALPPEVVSQLVCDFWGEAGRCRGNESLEPVANDPQGFNVTINGNLNGVPFSCGSSCSVPLPEGVGSANYIAISSSGRTADGSSSWQRDGTPPIINHVFSGFVGKNGWCVSEVEVSANASDEISGPSLLSGSIDEGGTWNSLPIHVPDGIHSVTFYARDLAGNEAIENEIIHVDTVPPVAQFTSHTDGQIVQGKVALGGKLQDETSGIASAELSLDGAIWLQTSITPENTWSFSWNAGEVPNGQYRLQVRGIDRAGNISDAASITVAVDNPSSQVSSVEDTRSAAIPFTATPTLTVTPSPTLTITVTPESTSTATSSPAIPTSALITPTPRASSRPAQKALSFPFWQTVGLVALFLAVASASVVDPRPAALDRLRETIHLLSSQNKEEDHQKWK